MSGLAAHVARGGVWVVADFLATPIPPSPLLLETPAQYVVAVINAASPDAHGSNRETAAAIAAVGQDELVSQLLSRLESLEAELRTIEPAQLIAVTGGNVLRLDDYLATRIVEQVVHLDDLARSVGCGLWPYPEEARDIAIAVGLDAAKLRSGEEAVLRALYRGGFSEGIFPVL